MPENKIVCSGQELFLEELFLLPLLLSLRSEPEDEDDEDEDEPRSEPDISFLWSFFNSSISFCSLSIQSDIFSSMIKLKHL